MSTYEQLSGSPSENLKKSEMSFEDLKELIENAYDREEKSTCVNEYNEAEEIVSTRAGVLTQVLQKIPAYQTNVRRIVLHRAEDLCSQLLYEAEKRTADGPLCVHDQQRSFCKYVRRTIDEVCGTQPFNIIFNEAVREEYRRAQQLMGEKFKLPSFINPSPTVTSAATAQTANAPLADSTTAVPDSNSPPLPQAVSSQEIQWRKEEIRKYIVEEGIMEIVGKALNDFVRVDLAGPEEKASEWILGKNEEITDANYRIISLFIDALQRSIKKTVKACESEVDFEKIQETFCNSLQREIVQVLPLTSGILGLTNKPNKALLSAMEKYRDQVSSNVRAMTKEHVLQFTDKHAITPLHVESIVLPKTSEWCATRVKNTNQYWEFSPRERQYLEKRYRELRSFGNNRTVPLLTKRDRKNLVDECNQQFHGTFHPVRTDDIDRMLTEIAKNFTETSPQKQQQEQSKGSEEKKTIAEIACEIGTNIFSRHRLRDFINTLEDNLPSALSKNEFLARWQARGIYIADIQHRLPQADCPSKLLLHYLAVEKAQFEKHKTFLRNLLSPQQLSELAERFAKAYEDFEDKILALANEGSEIAPTVIDEYSSLSLETPGLTKDIIGFAYLNEIARAYLRVFEEKKGGTDHKIRKNIKWSKLQSDQHKMKSGRVQRIFWSLRDKIIDAFSTLNLQYSSHNSDGLLLFHAVANDCFVESCRKSPLREILSDTELTSMRAEFKTGIELANKKLLEILQQKSTSSNSGKEPGVEELGQQSDIASERAETSGNAVQAVSSEKSSAGHAEHSTRDVVTLLALVQAEHDEVSRQKDLLQQQRVELIGLQQQLAAESLATRAIRESQAAEQRRIDAQREAIHQQTEELVSKKVKLAEISVRLFNRKDEIDAEWQKLLEERQKMVTQEEKLLHDRNELEKDLRELTALEEKIAREQIHLTDEKGRLESTKTELQSEQQEIRRTFLQQAEEKGRLNEQIHHFNRDMKILREEMKTLYQERESLMKKSAEVEHLRAQYTEVTTLREKVMRERALLKEQRHVLDDDRASLDTDREEFEAERQEFEQRAEHSDPDLCIGALEEQKSELTEITRNESIAPFSDKTAPDNKSASELPADLKAAHQDCGLLRRQVIDIMNTLDRTRESAITLYLSIKELVDDRRNKVSMNEVRTTFMRANPQTNFELYVAQCSNYLQTVYQKKEVIKKLFDLAEKWEKPQDIENARVMRERLSQNTSKKMIKKQTADSPLVNVFSNSKKMYGQIKTNKDVHIGHENISDEEFALRLEQTLKTVPHCPITVRYSDD